MSKVLKEKMYDYEIVPPQGVWESIAVSLDSTVDTKSVPDTAIPKKNYSSKKFIYAIAATVVLIAIGIMLFKSFSNKPATDNYLASSDSIQNPASSLTHGKSNPSYHGIRKDALIHVPTDDSSAINDETLLAKNNPAPDTGPADKTSEDNNDDKTKNTDSKKDVKSSKNHTYITITGPQGQPVKVSSKVAGLLVFADENSMPDPKWDKKIMEWKNAMQSNTLAATPGNFLDIIELTNTLSDN